MPPPAGNEQSFFPDSSQQTGQVIEKLVQAPPIGEARDRELLKDAHSFVYFNSPHGDLAAHFFIPPGHDPDTDRAPVVVFFHGGLWDSSMPTQFVPHCLHFASRGAVTLSVEYRVKSKHEVTPVDAVEDASMLYLFLKKNAHLLGIDVERIVFAGAGSGAHLALCCATLPEIGGEPGEFFRPRALVLFSPIVDTTRKGVGAERFPNDKVAKAFSPSTFIGKGLPPLLVFHAQLDRVVPIEQVRKFIKRYTRKKNRGELLDFASAGHRDAGLRTD